MQEMIVIPSADVIQQMQILVPINLRSTFDMESHGERIIHEMVKKVLSALVDQFLTSEHLPSGADGLASHSPGEVSLV